MLILIYRHPESTKNTEVRFAGVDEADIVTEKGYAEIATANAMLEGLTQGVNTIAVYGPGSTRCREAIDAISEVVGVSPIWLDDLVSIRGGLIAGKTEAQVEQELPEYSRQLDVYRHGLISSYDLGHTGEDLHSFEERVSACLRIVEGHDVRIAVVVMHKSAATAALISYARRFHNYPDEFFGYVDLPTGSVSVVDTTQGEILRAGAVPSRLLADQVRTHISAIRDS